MASGLVLDRILKQAFLCCPWFSSFSLVPDAEEVEGRRVSKRGPCGWVWTELQVFHAVLHCWLLGWGH